MVHSWGAPDILIVALDAGYGSHEAFTRAFRDQFGVTPEAVRLRGIPDNFELVEPMKMTETERVELEQPRREAGTELLIAGLRRRYSVATTAGIPVQWQQFRSWLDDIPMRIGGIAYGVCYDYDEIGHYDYITGVAVSSLSGLPPELSGVRVPAGDYLVFRHRGHVSGIGATWREIMERWLPASGIRMKEAPCFERMADDFNSETGMGVVEIWIPVQA